MLEVSWRQSHGVRLAPRTNLSQRLSSTAPSGAQVRRREHKTFMIFRILLFCSNVARYVEFYVRCSKKKAKKRWAIVKPKLDNTRHLRENTVHIEPNDEEFKLTMKAARRKLEVEHLRNPPQYWETQDKTRLCCRCRRKHETKARKSWTQTSSSRSHTIRTRGCLFLCKYLPRPCVSFWWLFF